MQAIPGKGLIRHPIWQYAYYVNDLDQSMHRWTRMFGAGPWHVARHHRAEHFRYRGKAIEADVSYAFGQCGPAHIQLIEQHDDTPSIYRDMYRRGEEGFHHVGCLVSNWAEEVKRFTDQGFEVATSLWAIDDVAYIDCRRAIGCFVELHGDHPTIVQAFKQWKDEHDAWDGVTDLIREG